MSRPLTGKAEIFSIDSGDAILAGGKGFHHLYSICEDRSAYGNLRGNLAPGDFSLPDKRRFMKFRKLYPDIKDYDLVVTGRRKKSRSEELEMGDISVKLIRALDEKAVLVVK